MGEPVPVAPEPPAPPRSTISPLTRGVLAAALVLSGVVGASCLLPWYTEQQFEDSRSVLGVMFIEGMVDFALACACFVLFLIVLIKNEPKSRARLAAIAACLSLGMALAPLELFARGAYTGIRSVYVIGLGYSGWSYGLYTALIAGFVAAAMGGLGAGRVSDGQKATPVKLQSLRKPARPLDERSS